MAGYGDEYGEAVDQGGGDDEANALSALQLGVRGYACHVFDDARVAWSLHREQHLIPWRMESDLHVDRFDARNLLDDKALFRRLKKPQRSNNTSNSGAATTDAEKELHALRYGDYEVEFPPPVVEETPVENLFPYAYPEDHDDEEADGEAYEPPWLVPENLTQPKSKKLHEIIAATAKKAREHPQLEVMLKVKLSANAKFGFLEPSHGFHAYYTHLRDENPPIRETLPVVGAKNSNGASLLLGAEYDSDSEEEADDPIRQSEDKATVVDGTGEPERPADGGDEEEEKEKKAMRLRRAKLLAGHFQHAALEKKEAPLATSLPAVEAPVVRSDARSSEAGVAVDGEAGFEAEVEAKSKANSCGSVSAFQTVSISKASSSKDKEVLGRVNLRNIPVAKSHVEFAKPRDLSLRFSSRGESAMEKAATVDNAKKSSPPLMVDGVAEGVATFPSKPSSVFRYALKMKDDTVSIWLEDKKSKQQWKSKDVSVDGFASLENAIPRAKLSDYVQCFCDCLAASETNGSERDVTGYSTGALKLTFTLKLRVLTSEWTSSYTFKLEPVTLEPVAVLNSKMRDQEEEIEDLRSALKASENGKEEAIDALRSQVKEFKKSAQLVFVTAKPKKNVSQNCTLVWHKTASRGDDTVVELTPSGTIRFLNHGLFDMRIAVSHTSSNANVETFQLLKSDVRVDGCYDTWNVGSRQNATLNCFLEVAPNDEYAVLYTGNNYAYAESSLIIVAMAIY